jgi:hypothetical protein
MNALGKLVRRFSPPKAIGGDMRRYTVHSGAGLVHWIVGWWEILQTP